MVVVEYGCEGCGNDYATRSEAEACEEDCARRSKEQQEHLERLFSKVADSGRPKA